MTYSEISSARNHEKMYRDDDELVAHAAWEVICENSGYEVPLKNISHILKCRGIEGRLVTRTVRLYPYALVKNVVVSRTNAGRPLISDPSPATLYQRTLYARRKAVPYGSVRPDRCIDCDTPIEQRASGGIRKRCVACARLQRDRSSAPGEATVQ